MRRRKIEAAPETLISPETSFDIAQQVINERVHQDTKWGQQNHPDGTGGPQREHLAQIAKNHCEHAFRNGIGTWQHILTEEVAEAFAETDPALLRAELIQVAAVASAWAEAIDRRTVVVP